MENRMQKYDSKILSKIQNLILYFFIFAFLGWVLETIYSFIVLGHFTKRGFLFGPLCPIYGFSAIIMILALNKYKNNIIKLFFYSIVIFSGFEYIAGFLLDAIFSIRLWDYTLDFLNLNGRISVFYSISWGIITIIFVKYMFQFTEKIVNFIINKISYTLKSILIYTLCCIYILDTLFSFIRWG